MSRRASTVSVSGVIGALLLAPGLAHAAAGNVLFTLGRVEIQRNGQTLPAQRGSSVEIGDTVSTGPTGLTQLRMKDGSLMALRAGTSMTIEDFLLPATPEPGTAVSSDSARSVFRLVRGAFRTVTGLIGKAARDDYRVITPAATIGIRGTDYTAAYCSGDCEGSADGLYVGVSSGKVIVVNDQGQLPLDDNEYAYVKDAGTPPAQATRPPKVLEQELDGAGDEEPDGEREPGAVGEFENPNTGTSLVTGTAQPEGSYELLPGEAARLAFSLGPFQTASDFAGVTTNGAYRDAAGNLVGFLAGDTRGVAMYGVGTALNLDVDSDPATGLRWGRWHDGTITVGSTSLLLDAASLHWIYALAPQAPVLPSSGTVNYTHIGNTNPTDNNGNIGFLNSATFTADFANQTVASTLNLDMNGKVWQATSGSGSILSGAPVFTGGYNVIITDAVGSTIGTGGGSFAGFFTNSGAGLSYSLASGATTVNGAAAFSSAAQAAATAP